MARTRKPKGVIEVFGVKVDLDDGGKIVGREKIDTSHPGDWGCDPLGDGTFRMVPSGDVVGPEEMHRRLARPPR